jgi:hypothetical protein
MSSLVPLLLLATTLVLRSGDRIKVEGTPVAKDGVYTFRSEGTLYSLPAVEVERVDTEAEPAAAGKPADKSTDETKKADPPKRRVLTEEERRQLLADLERNHGGAAPPPEQKPPVLPPPPTKEEVREQKLDEAAWRREARAYDEAVRRAKEDLELLETRVAELQAKIQSLVSLGYKPSQFTYDTTQLHRTIEQIPQAKLEVQRAIRAQEQFREDARREGVLPGWLR